MLSCFELLDHPKALKPTALTLTLNTDPETLNPQPFGSFSFSAQFLSAEGREQPKVQQEILRAPRREVGSVGLRVEGLRVLEVEGFRVQSLGRLAAQRQEVR